MLVPSPERGRGRPVVGVIGSSLPCTRSANIPALLESALMKQETSLVLLNLGSLVHAFLALCDGFSGDPLLCAVCCGCLSRALLGRRLDQKKLPGQHWPSRLGCLAGMSLRMSGVSRHSKEISQQRRSIASDQTGACECKLVSWQVCVCHWEPAPRLPGLRTPDEVAPAVLVKRTL